MSEALDLSKTFVHLSDRGDAAPVPVTRSLFAGREGERYDRLLGAFAFESEVDLHADVQEMHPEADEVIVLMAGALDVVLDEGAGERRISLEAGEAAIVPRGVWHRLVARRPGRLVFVNSRAGMQSRPRRGGSAKEERAR